MAIKEIKMYYVECDNCKKSLFEHDDYSAYADVDLAIQAAVNNEDSLIDFEGKDYCPSCAIRKQVG